MRQKSRYKVAVASALVLAVCASLWFAGPVRALNVDITNPSSAIRGGNYQFTVAVNVEDVDCLPIRSVDLYIYKSDNRTTYEAHCDNLPLSTTTTAYTRTSAQTASGTSAEGGAVTISASTAAGWGYGYAYRYGYGYMETGGAGYHYFGSGEGGYGYSSGGYVGTTSITYTVKWISPTIWPTGAYKIQSRVYANSDYFTSTSSEFTLFVPSGGGGGAPPAPTLEVTIGGQEFEHAISEEGVLLVTIEGTSEDGNLDLILDEGTTALDEDGEPISSLGISVNPSPPSPPAGNIIVLAYNFEPSGATFSPPMNLTWTYNDADIPPGVAEGDMVPAFYNEATGEWVTLDNFTIDPATNTATLEIPHFTTFALVAAITPPVTPVAPAAFTTSDLTISPAAVDIGEEVTISVLVTNTGELTGSYEVAIKIDNVVVATGEVTLAGDASQEVTFTTARNVAGTYDVNVDELSATFTVKAAPVIPPTPLNWQLIGGIIAGVIIVVLLIYFFALRRRRETA